MKPTTIPLVFSLVAAMAIEIDDGRAEHGHVEPHRRRSSRATEPRAGQCTTRACGNRS